MCLVAFDIPNRLMREAGMDEKGMNTFSQQMLAVGLYRQGRLSVGRCASLAGMNEADFIDFLDAMGVSVFGNMTAEDMKEEGKALDAFFKGIQQCAE